MTFEEWFKEENWGPVYGDDSDFHYGASVAWDYKQAEIDALQKKYDKVLKAFYLVEKHRYELGKRVDELHKKLAYSEDAHKDVKLKFLNEEDDLSALKKRIDELMAKKEFRDLSQDLAIKNIKDGYEKQVGGLAKSINKLCNENDALQKRIDELEAKREGFVLVPKEPTDKMVAHMINTPIDVNLLCDHADTFLSESEAYIAYKAMLSAVEVQNGLD